MGVKKGRPTKLTKTMQDRIVKQIRRGLPYRDVAAMVGIAVATLRKWRMDGERLLERKDKGDTLTAAEKQLATFSAACRKAEAEVVGLCLDSVLLAAEEGQWAAGMTYAERRRPDEFGRKQRIEAEVKTSVVTVYPAIQGENISSTLTLPEGEYE